MMTFEDLYTRGTVITSDTSATNVTFMKALVNETQKNLSAMFNWHFLEKTATKTSTASQQEIQLPVDCIRLKTYRLTNGDNDYTPREIQDPIEFDRLNANTTNTTSDFPTYFHIRNGVILNFPAISTAGLTITLEYLAMPKDMTLADYTTGTITSITNGGTAVVGDSTVWATPTNAIAGEYIKMPDGLWYEIASITDNTHLTLSKPYQGTTIAAGTASYTIGELPTIPEAFHDLLWYRPVGIYFQMKGQESKANFYFSGEPRRSGLYESQLSQLRRTYSTKTTQTVYPDRGSTVVVNPNSYPVNLS